MAYVNLGQVMYPVGAIYQSWSATSPASLFGGSWSQITEKFLYCANSAGGTGGASTVTLSVKQMPSHSHRPPSGYFIVQNDNGSMRQMTPMITNTGTGSDGMWRGRLAENSGQQPLSTVNEGGGHLTRICHPISDVTLGDALLNLFIGGGLVWHM